MKDVARILVVDDERAVNLVLEELLSEAGYEVAFATNCAEGLSKLEQEAFDVVIADKNLPDESGMEIIRKARTMDQGPEAIMITGYASLETAIEAMDLGARGYLLKPFEDVAEVLEKVQKVLAAANERKKMAKLIEELRQSNETASSRKK